MVRRVVVTGLGTLNPLGNTVHEYWDKLLKGVSGAGPITRFDASAFKTQFACEIKNLNLEDHFDRKFIRKNDPFTLYALISSREAMVNAGLNADDSYNANRFGVIWASGNGGITTFEQEVIAYAEAKQNGPRFSPFFIPKILADTPSGAIALEHELRGINYCTVSACASATSAIMDAYNYIKWGHMDVMLSGGSEAPITQAGIGGFNAMKALSTRNDDPVNASRPFDKSRDGFVMGEGAGALVLEELDHAKKRGATIYAEVVGAGMSNDAYHATATHPEGLGAQLAMKMALDEAQVKSSEIDYINLHATSTPVGDASEIIAIRKLFGNDLSSINFSATKSMTGHLLGAAGGIEAIATVQAMVHGIIPPTINSTDLDEEVGTDVNLTLQNAQERKVNYAMSNTFGFGGHNAIVLFKAFN